MRIAYVAQLSTGVESGVLRKVRSQVLAWRDLGHEVMVLALSPTAAVWPGIADVGMDIHSYSWAGGRLGCAESLVRAARSGAPDVIYFRCGPAYPPLLALHRIAPVVIEINGDVEREAAAALGRVRGAAVSLLFRQMMTRASGVVSVSRELAGRLRRFGLPIAVIGNSIPLAEYRPVLPVRSTPPRLCFVGTAGFPWNGIEDICCLAAEMKQWIFSLVGISPADIPEGYPCNVHCHGYLSGEALRAMLEETLVGIGTLALYRKGLDETSSLKLREYLAYGVPTVLGHDDPDFPDPVDFILRVPNRPGGILEMKEELASFITRWSGKRVPRAAVAHLDTTIKERARLRFIEGVVRTGGYAVCAECGDC